MSKQPQTQEAQAEKKRQRRIEPHIIDGEAATADWFTGPASPFRGGTLDSQVAMLERLDTAQQQSVIRRIGHVQGNRHIQRVVAALQLGKQGEYKRGGAGEAAAPVSIHPTGVQTKLTVGEPDDRYEQEADRVADVVMKMPAPALPPDGDGANGTSLHAQTAKTHSAPLHPEAQPGDNGVSVSHQDSRPIANKPLAKSPATGELGEQYEEESDEAAEAVQRELSFAPPTPPDEGEDSSSAQPPTISRAPAISLAQDGDGSAPIVPPDLETRIEGMKGTGKPLPPTERAFFEERMEADFSDVRVHTGDTAVQTARDLGARAYTVGKDIAFGAGEYELGAEGGRRLVAHELTHVVQQRGVTVGKTIKCQALSEQTTGMVNLAKGDPKGKLAALHPAMQAKVHELLRNAQKKGLDVWIFEGMRTIARQNELYAQGRTTKGKIVTKVKGGASYHNYGVAVDIVFAGKQPWGEQHDWAALGTAGQAAGLEWGGAWKSFQDRPHFQLPDLKISLLKKWYTEGGIENVWKNISAGGNDVSANKKNKTETGTAIEEQSYIVQKGELPKHIAAKFGVDETALVNRNKDKLKTWGKIQGFNTGETIVIPTANEITNWKALAGGIGKTIESMWSWISELGGDAKNKMPSGKSWCRQFPTSKSMGTLSPTFGKNVQKFINAMEIGGAKVKITSTLRPPERAYLMHWAWRITKKNYDPRSVPAKKGVNISWWHGNMTKSKIAAKEMVVTYGLTKLKVPPSLRSRHIKGEAIDMVISWTGDLEIKNASGVKKVIKSSPKNGINPELIAVGKTFKVVHYRTPSKDAVHWSTTGG